MPEGYELHDGQFLQLGAYISAADALLLSSSLVPAGRVWTILSASAWASATETQDYWWSVWRNSVYNVLTNPASRTVNNGIVRHVAFVTEGMEMKLFPGEGLSVHRAAATAGSTISMAMRFIETDLPFYFELDKAQNLQRTRRAIQMSKPYLRRGGFVSGGGGGGVSEGGGGGRSLPK